MSASSFRTPETPEEGQMRAAVGAVGLASVLSALMEKPTLMKQLGADAAASLAMVDAEVNKRNEALAAIEKAAGLKKEILDARAAVESDKIALAERQRLNSDELARREAAMNKALDVRSTQLKAAAAQLEIDKTEHMKAVSDHEGRVAALDGREAQINTRAEKLEASYQELMEKTRQENDKRTAALDKREKTLDAKAKKFEELKAALKE